jgi:hypothetical protein
MRLWGIVESVQQDVSISKLRPVKWSWQTLQKTCVLLHGPGKLCGKKCVLRTKKRIISTIFVFIEEKLKRAVRRINKVQWRNFEHENIQTLQYHGKSQIKAIRRKISNKSNLIDIIVEF